MKKNNKKKRKKETGNFLSLSGFGHEEKLGSPTIA